VPHPASTASTHHSWDIPQAKTLAETPDVILNQRIKAALLSDLSSNAQEITPATAKGVVTLTGAVKTSQQRARAEQVARKVRGVRAVKNKLAVRSG
jgi:osmotically-inducible protein OsmY